MTSPMTRDATESDVLARLSAGDITPEDAADELGWDYDAAADAAVRPGWVVAGDGSEEAYPDAAGAEDAVGVYVESYDASDDGESYAVVVWTWRVGFDADGQEVRVREGRRIYIVHPDEPECDSAADGAHRWRDDYELVGGCRESPGVWGGRGCAIDSQDVCVLCGLSRWQGGPSQGVETEYDHSYVRYEAGGAGVDDLAQYHAGDMPDGLLSASALGRRILADALWARREDLETWAMSVERCPDGDVWLLGVAEGDEEEVAREVGGDYAVKVWWRSAGRSYLTSAPMDPETAERVTVVSPAH